MNELKNKMNLLNQKGFKLIYNNMNLMMILLKQMLFHWKKKIKN